MKKNVTKYHSKEDALKKLMKYCAYQERCHKEARTKLLELGIRGHDLEDIIVTLIEENFLNEERFAISYARGKYRIKRWGKVKICQELKARDISAYCIRKALEEINDATYLDSLKEVLTKYYAARTFESPHQAYTRLLQYGVRRGYEYEYVKVFAKDLTL